MKSFFGLLFFILIAGHMAWKHWGRDGASPELSTAQIHALAGGIKADEIVMYSTTECPYCHAAKGWLAHNGFAFIECNMSIERRCEVEFNAYGADGTPFLVIRRGGKQHLMKNGFDSDEFLMALQG